MKTNLKIRLLYQIENKFNGFDLEAMLDEPKMGMKDLSAWNRIVLFPIMRR
ncbi:MAG: STAS/SEC14 domain-containing protein [Paludibacter sp.]|nr:STAS/SEC14 domain-containing protein [Paludibacter sp.]